MNKDLGGLDGPQEDGIMSEGKFNKSIKSGTSKKMNNSDLKEMDLITEGFDDEFGCVSPEQHVPTMDATDKSLKFEVNQVDGKVSPERKMPNDLFNVG